MAVESDAAKGHMSNMRKFHHHRVAISAFKDINLKPMAQPIKATVFTCVNFPVKIATGHALAEGVRSISLFPTMRGVLDKFEPNGVRSDWLKVGCDIRAGMNIWSSGRATVDERESA